VEIDVAEHVGEVVDGRRLPDRYRKRWIDVVDGR
jgi:hypothetical protein